MYDTRKTYRDAKEQAIPEVPRSSGSKQAKRKAKPKPKADHAHVWDQYIEAAGPEDDARVEWVKVCTVCGKRTQPKGLSWVTEPKIPGKPGVALILHASAARLAGFTVRVRTNIKTE